MDPEKERDENDYYHQQNIQFLNQVILIKAELTKDKVNLKLYEF